MLVGSVVSRLSACADGLVVAFVRDFFRRLAQRSGQRFVIVIGLDFLVGNGLGGTTKTTPSAPTTTRARCREGSGLLLAGAASQTLSSVPVPALEFWFSRLPRRSRHPLSAIRGPPTIRTWHFSTMPLSARRQGPRHGLRWIGMPGDAQEGRRSDATPPPLPRSDKQLPAPPIASQRLPAPPSLPQPSPARTTQAHPTKINKYESATAHAKDPSDASGTTSTALLCVIITPALRVASLAACWC